MTAFWLVGGLRLEPEGKKFLIGVESNYPLV